MDYTIEKITPDKAGVEFFLAKYKPFRLQALQTDPQFFGSTYEKEAAKEDEFWRLRVSRPEATTFVAVHAAPDRRILSSVTLIRGSQPSPLLAMAAGLTPEERDKDSAALLHWAVNGVYTARNARRRGIAGAVFAQALAFSFATAADEGKSCLVSILVREENEVAIGMYQRMGFVDLGYVEADSNAVLYMFKAREEPSLEIA